MGQLKVRNLVSGTWDEISLTGPVGATGLAGPTGPTGAQGVSSIIVGDFGAITTPSDLPPDGLIPADWDGPGNPAAPYQTLPGQSLYYDQPTDVTLDGHLFQYVGTSVMTEGWLDIGLIQGPAGPEGVPGPTGPKNDEVWVGPDDPTVPKPTAELWFDTDDDRILGPTDLPPGGLAGQPLLKQTDLDGDVNWGGLLQQEQQANFDGHVYLNNNVHPVGTFQLPIKWPNAEGDKLLMYPGTTPGTNSFGLGVTSGALSIFVGSAGNKISFRHGGHNGGEFTWFDHTQANFMDNAINTTGTVNAGSVTANGPVVIKGSDDANSNRFFADGSDNNTNQFTPVFEARRQDLKPLFRIVSWQNNYVGTTMESEMHVEVGGGDDGWKRIGMFKIDGSDGQRVYYNNDYVSATHFDDRSSLATKDNVVPLDPSVAKRVINGLTPITFTRKVEPGIGATEIGRNRPPIPLVSIAIEDIEAADTPITRHLVHGEGDDRGYSIGGMLSCAISVIKEQGTKIAELEQRLAQLEGGGY